MSEKARQAIQERILRSDACQRITAWCQQETCDTYVITKAAGSLPAFLLHAAWAATGRFLVCLLPNPDDALFLHSDLLQLSVPPEHLLLFPPSGRMPYDQEQLAHSQAQVQRVDALQRLSEGFSGLVVTSTLAATERTPTKNTLEIASRTLVLGDTVEPGTLIRELVDQGFARVRFVEQPGEVAWRGGIVDVYSYAGDYPVRLEFLGDDIESLREFDARTQRSVSSLEHVRIVPQLERFAATSVEYSSLFDYIPKDSRLVLFDSLGFQALVNDRMQEATSRHEAADPALNLAAPEQRYMDYGALEKQLLRWPRLLLGSFTEADGMEAWSARSRPQPAFARQLTLLRSALEATAENGGHTFVCCDSSGQMERLTDLLQFARDAGQVTFFVQSLHQGFELPEVGLALYTDHEIFGRYHRPATRKTKAQGGIRLHELRSLKPGDFVVHTEYGVGSFAGIRKIVVRDKEQEAVRLHYQGGDVLYVNVHALHKLHKYTAKEGTAPRLTKLGSGQWERSKRKAKSRIKDIARDLIKLYAQRKAATGFQFQPDTVWQREMEAAFPYEDTPDQFTAAEDIKRDMEATAPMDRLVCGDVGFGKTEVAIRAAFKAAQEGKQVAILVPTTVLARQHLDTFAQRLEPFPVRVEMLTRHRTGAAARAILSDLKDGKVDVLIGTHRIISKDIIFKDLGLLIVDEEQRFGVGVKERLRQLRVNVDTLTLTATPIPRTLQFSLMGARDLSLIHTPPPNRQSIVTEIHSFDKQLIKDAILYEVSRGGQVFFLHNRVQSIEDTASMLRDLIPGVRLQIAHGQMRAADMERVMTAFIDRKFDVLVSTTIIENGLDIPNANTMIIHHAQRFGLAELHQLRGRVGRSDRKAFCYLLVPSIHALTRQARQRLRAVEQITELGGGFQIAMRDLDIRGAGNVLGGEQSGFIADLGFDTYQQVLDEAVRELRADEFPSLSAEASVPPAVDAVVDVQDEAALPIYYVESDLERLGLYRRISEAPTPKDLADIQSEIRDRFGALPQGAQNLFRAALLRLHALRLRLPRVQYRNQRLFLHLALDDAHFRDVLLQPLLEKLDGSSFRYVMKETKKGVPRAIVQQVPSLQAAVDLMASLAEPRSSHGA